MLEFSHVIQEITILQNIYSVQNVLKLRKKKSGYINGVRLLAIFCNQTQILNALDLFLLEIILGCSFSSRSA